MPPNFADPATPEYSGFIGWVLSLMTTMGEWGVGVALFAETILPFIPSEAVLPAAGFLAYEGKMSFWGALGASVAGGVLAAWLFYGVGYALGESRTKWLIERVPLLDGDDFDRASAFFHKYGTWAVLIGRCVPLVRSAISIPAGIQRMPFWKFTLLTLAGTAAWNSIWMGLGYVLGPGIQPVLERWSGVLSYLVVAILVGLLVWFIIGRLRRNSRRRTQGAAPSADADHQGPQ